MFNNVGGKIKSIARIYFGILLAGSVIGGLVYLFNQYLWWLGLIILVGGFLTAWVSSLFLYGFGELIENSAMIAKNGVTSSNGGKSASASYAPDSSHAKIKLKNLRDDGLITEEEYQQKLKTL